MLTKPTGVRERWRTPHHHTSPHGLVSLDSISLRFVYGFLCLSGIHIDGDSRGRLHFKRTTRAGREWPPEAHFASCVKIPLLLSAVAWPSITLLPTHAGRSMDQRVSIVEVRREEERDAALQHASLHEIGSKTARRCAAPQPALTRYTLLEIERIEHRAAPEGAVHGAPQSRAHKPCVQPVALVRERHCRPPARATHRAALGPFPLCHGAGV
jgi:hypothetical protein